MRKRITTTIGMLLIISGCAKNEFYSVVSDVNDGVLKKTDRPICEVDGTEYILSSKIQSYDITSTGGGNFGFNLFTGMLRAFGLKFTTKTGEVWVTTGVYSPLNYNSEIRPEQNSSLVIASQRTRATDKSFKFNIDMAMFGIGFDYYWKTPLSKLTENGLRNSLQNAVEQMKAIENPWTTKVGNIVNGMAVIQAGREAGLQEGDELEFYNVEYAWKNKPCGEYLMPVPTTIEPIATGRVQHLDTMAAAVVLDIKNSKELVDVGTVVKLKAFSQKSGAERKLLRAVKVVDMPSQQIPIDGSANKMDFSPYANVQFRSMLRENGFYLKK